MSEYRKQHSYVGGRLAERRDPAPGSGDRDPLAARQVRAAADSMVLAFRRRKSIGLEAAACSGYVEPGHRVLGGVASIMGGKHTPLN